MRTPDEREGDLTAQIAAANRVADSRPREVVAKYGPRRIEGYATALQDYTERVLKATIAEIPDGEYRFEDALDDTGSTPGLSPSGSPSAPPATRRRRTSPCDPQTNGGGNANFAITLYAFRCLVNQDVLYNLGIGRPVRVIAPEGPS